MQAHACFPYGANQVRDTLEGASAQVYPGERERRRQRRVASYRVDRFTNENLSQLQRLGTVTRLYHISQVLRRLLLAKRTLAYFLPPEIRSGHTTGVVRHWIPLIRTGMPFVRIAHIARHGPERRPWPIFESRRGSILTPRG